MLLIIIWIWSWWSAEKEIVDPMYLKLKEERDKLAEELDRISNELQVNGVHEMDSKILHIKLTIMKIDYLLDTYIK